MLNLMNGTDDKIYSGVEGVLIAQAARNIGRWQGLLERETDPVRRAAYAAVIVHLISPSEVERVPKGVREGIRSSLIMEAWGYKEIFEEAAKELSSR